MRDDREDSDSEAYVNSKGTICGRTPAEWHMMIEEWKAHERRAGRPVTFRRFNRDFLARHFPWAAETFGAPATVLDEPPRQEPARWFRKEEEDDPDMPF